MNEKQGRPLPYPLASQPSTSFSSVSSAASATSAASSKSGCSKLLFGEIDTNSERSTENYASVCSFVICDSGKFLTFWLNDTCREAFLSHVPASDLASLRLACHDFSVRAAPALFNALSITFRSSTFTKPARLAALDRLGYYVKTLHFSMPHSDVTFLPPLVDPESGAELSFTYTPQVEPSTPSQPKYGDLGTTEILTKQYPPLFHAATNVPAFVRAFSAFINLETLEISCPGYDPSTRYRRSIVDFALISLRIAVERNCLNALTNLILSSIHPGGLLYLSPCVAYGSTPRSASRWARITNLTIHSYSLPVVSGSNEPDHYRLLQAFLGAFRSNLAHFNFKWLHQKGPLPIRQCLPPKPNPTANSSKPAKTPKTTLFPRLKRIAFENLQLPASTLTPFIEAHKRTLTSVDMSNIDLTGGTWDEALQPIIKLNKQKPRNINLANIPILLSPSTLHQAHMPTAKPAAVHAISGKAHPEHLFSTDKHIRSKPMLETSALPLLSAVAYVTPVPKAKPAVLSSATAIPAEPPSSLDTITEPGATPSALPLLPAAVYIPPVLKAKPAAVLTRPDTAKAGNTTSTSHEKSPSTHGPESSGVLLLPAVAYVPPVSKARTSRKVRDGIHGCEESLRKMLSGVVPWKDVGWI